MLNDMALRYKCGCLGLLVPSTPAFLLPAKCWPTNHWTAVFRGGTSLVFWVYALYQMKYEMEMH